MKKVLLLGVAASIAMWGCGGSQSKTVTQVKVHGFANASGATGTYWVRSSSMDNASHLISSPMILTIASGNVKLGDSFYVGKRGAWALWVNGSTYIGAGSYVEGRYTFDLTGEVHLRLWNPDGSIRKSYTRGSVHMEFVNGQQQIANLTFTPPTPDEEFAGTTTLASNQPVTGTELVIEER